MSLILIVEPDRALGNIYSEALNSVGYHTVVASSAQTALHAIDENLPNLIILELELATHNGIEFLYELRSYIEWQSIPVLILSQVTPNKSAKQPKAWGQLNVAGYLYKPSTKLSNLIAKVGAIINE